MTVRFVTLFVFAALLSGMPAAASQPEGLAGEIIVNAAPTPPGAPGFTCGFEWLLGDYELPLESTDTVSLNLALVPFASGVTNIGLDFGPSYATAVSLIFADGLVNGSLPYDRNVWNDIFVQFNVARLEYDVTINGRHGGPFSSASECSGGGCTTVASFRVNGGSDNTPGATAWIDSISVIRHALTGDEFYVGFTAEACVDHPSVNGGGLVFLEPPKKLRLPR